MKNSVKRRPRRLAIASLSVAAGAILSGALSPAGPLGQASAVWGGHSASHVSAAKSIVWGD